MSQDFIKIIILYYVFFIFYYILGEGPKTKRGFWLTLTPLAIIIYPIIWIVKWYKTLK
jgi:hypothetical protein